VERAGVISSAVSSGIMSDASHDDLKQRPHAGKPRGAGERWRKSFSGYPLTTGCGNRILYLEAPDCRWRFESFKPQSRRRPLSPTPAPPRRPHRNLALCKFGSDITGWTCSLRQAQSVLLRGYFFFFAATLRLAGAFFFAAVFAFVAFFTILPSWPKPSGGVASAPARIAGTASRLLQAERKKNVSHQGNVCGASSGTPAGRQIASRGDMSSRVFQRAAASPKRNL
jgi:hypothetical protein